MSLDGTADNGEAGENDDAKADVENVLGGSDGDQLVGSADDNALTGGAGNDSVQGGAGNDTLHGGTGADTLAGGAGTDTADYGARAAPLTVTLDGGANDGETGENDNARADVENVIGGAGDDSLVGSAAANVLNAGADVAEADGVDTAAADCERGQPASARAAGSTDRSLDHPAEAEIEAESSKRRATPKPSLPAVGTPRLAAPRTVKIAPNGAITLPFQFPRRGSGSCRGKIVLSARLPRSRRPQTIGRAAFAGKPGKR